MDGAAKSLIRRARSGTQVSITDIKTRAPGSRVEIKEATDMSFNLVN